MPWGAAAAATAAVAGSYMSSQAAKSAANTSADAQRYAADQAAEAARFKPYGVTTGFATSNFGTDAQGNPTAGYTLTPEMIAIRDRMLSQAGAYDTTQLGTAAQPLYGAGSRLFDLGNQYLATSPEAAAQQWMTQQQGLLAPGREQELARVQNQQYQTGRAGLGVGGTSVGYGAGQPGLGQSNPQLQALYNARAQQDASLASQATQEGRTQTAFGAGLFGTGGSLLGQIPALTTAGYGPLQTQLGLAGTIEGYGQQALDIGAQLGGRSATAGANVAQSLLAGGVSAAKTAQAGNASSWLGSTLQGVGNNTQLQNWFSKQLNNNQYDGWQTQGDNTYFGSNSSGMGSGEGYSGMNTDLGL